MWDDSMKDTPRLRYTAKKSYGVDELLMSSSRIQHNTEVFIP